MKIVTCSRILALTLIVSFSVPILSHSDLDILKEIANKDEQKVGVSIAQGADLNELVPFPDSNKKGTAIHFAVESLIKQVTNEQKTFTGRIASAWGGLKQFSAGALMTIAGGVAALAGYDSYRKREDLQKQLMNKASSMNDLIRPANPAAPAPVVNPQPVAPAPQPVAQPVAPAAAAAQPAVDQLQQLKIEQARRQLAYAHADEQRKQEVHQREMEARDQDAKSKNEWSWKRIGSGWVHNTFNVPVDKIPLDMIPGIENIANGADRVVNNVERVVGNVERVVGHADNTIAQIDARVGTLAQNINNGITETRGTALEIRNDLGALRQEVTDPNGLIPQMRRATRNSNDLIDTLNTVSMGALMVGGVIAAFFGIKKSIQGSYQILKSPLGFFGRRARIVVYKRIVKKLLDQSNLDLTVRNSDGKTALELVQEAMAKSFKSPENYRSLKEVEMWLKLRQEQLLGEKRA